jgi:hypothetical protein
VRSSLTAPVLCRESAGQGHDGGSSPRWCCSGEAVEQLGVTVFVVCFGWPDFV